MTDSEAVAFEIDRDFPLYGKPAMEEIYTFFSSEPKELPELPLWVMFYNTNMYINPFQDVVVTRPDDHPTIHAQDFEGPSYANYYLDLWQTMYLPEMISAYSRIDSHDPFEGKQALRVYYNNPYGKGGEALVIPHLNIGSWQDIETVSLAIRREDPNLGIALVLFDTENPQRTYTQRLPLHKVGEWEQIGVYVDNFDRVVGSGDTTIRSIGREHLNPNYIGILLYSLDGSPVNSKVYIDDIAVTLKSQE